MADEIVDFLLKKSGLTLSSDETKEVVNRVTNIFHHPLITERNISFKTLEDNYNFGNYFIGKDKDSESSMMDITDDFKKKYLSKTEQEIYSFFKRRNLSTDQINKWFLLYNTFVAKRIKMNKEIVIKDIFDYVID